MDLGLVHYEKAALVIRWDRKDLGGKVKDGPLAVAHLTSGINSAGFLNLGRELTIAVKKLPSWEDAAPDV